MLLWVSLIYRAVGVEMPQSETRKHSSGASLRTAFLSSQSKKVHPALRVFLVCPEELPFLMQLNSIMFLFLYVLMLSEYTEAFYIVRGMTVFPPVHPLGP